MSSNYHRLQWTRILFVKSIYSKVFLVKRWFNGIFWKNAAVKSRDFRKSRKNDYVVCNCTNWIIVSLIFSKNFVKLTTYFAKSLEVNWFDEIFFWFFVFPHCTFFMSFHQWRRKVWNIGEAQGGYFFLVNSLLLLVNLKYWAGLSLTDLTVSDAPVY